ncbi:g7070 [Coccomyxa viridis]|uniref:G7070 protein n=1 Tax=Coccomyxa viridis TaxID=1274662 RepID=A0ABP1FZG9_9CHLO
MAEAYFVSKKDLLQWINSTLSLNLTKVEQTSSGAVACQLLDALQPGVVNMNKVDFNAATEYDAVNNYKVLQAAFTKMGINKPVDVNKLVKGRPLDNMEFMQWLKFYFEGRLGCQDLDYDPVGRRQQSKSGDVKGARTGPTSTVAVARSSATASQSGTPAKSVASARVSSSVPKENVPANTGASARGAGALRPKAVAGDSTVADLTEQLIDLKLKVSTAEQEREFYFTKLRDIEVMCQMPEVKQERLVPFIERVLYAEDDEGAAQAMEDCCQNFSEASAQSAATDNAITNLVGQMSPLRM